MAEDMKDGKFVHNNTEAPQANRVLPLFSLKGKTAIVSGAAAGIGFAVVEAFAEAGANVAIWYNNNKVAVERAAEIEKTYGVKCRHSSPAHMASCPTSCGAADPLPLVESNRQSLPGQRDFVRGRADRGRSNRNRIQRATGHLRSQLGHPVDGGSQSGWQPSELFKDHDHER